MVNLLNDDTYQWDGATVILSPFRQANRARCALNKEILDLLIEKSIFTPHAQRERGKVIDRGVHIYVCSRKKYLNRTLEIDSPFQTLTVGLPVQFID